MKRILSLIIFAFMMIPMMLICGCAEKKTANAQYQQISQSAAKNIMDTNDD